MGIIIFDIFDQITDVYGSAVSNNIELELGFEKNFVLTKIHV